MRPWLRRKMPIPSRHSFLHITQSLDCVFTDSQAMRRNEDGREKYLPGKKRFLSMHSKRRFFFKTCCWTNTLAAHAYRPQVVVSIIAFSLVHFFFLWVFFRGGLGFTYKKDIPSYVRVLVRIPGNLLFSTTLIIENHEEMNYRNLVYTTTLIPFLHSHTAEMVHFLIIPALF